jgi:hypothetical protein
MHGTGCISPIYDPFVRKMFRHAPTVRSRMTAAYQVGNSFRLWGYVESPVASNAAINDSVRWILEFWPQ